MDTTPLDQAADRLTPGDLLFVHGQPRDLAVAGAHLSRRLAFKYWIAMEHAGLLLFWKPGGKFQLHTDAARVPHAYCAACGKPLKDWGGKRHLMNPRGTVLSDVWRDATPEIMASRLRALTGQQTPFIIEAPHVIAPPAKPLLGLRPARHHHSTKSSKPTVLTSFTLWQPIVLTSVLPTRRTTSPNSTPATTMLNPNTNTSRGATVGWPVWPAP